MTQRIPYYLNANPDTVSVSFRDGDIHLAGASPEYSVAEVTDVLNIIRTYDVQNMSQHESFTVHFRAKWIKESGIVKAHWQIDQL